MSHEKQPNAQQEANRLAIYQQLCSSYHAIDDFLAKLLGFLPLATGGGIFFLLNNLNDTAKQFLGPIGLFGFVVAALGLYFYELHGIMKCDHLIKVGKQIEGLLGINGQFTQRPFGVAGFINEPFTARVIYSSVLSAWTFLALSFTEPRVAVWIALAVFAIGFAGSFFLKLEVKLEA